MRTRRKPLAPLTVKAYEANLVRAFGPKPYRGKADLSEWTHSSLKILRAAALRFAPERSDDIPDEEYEVARVIKPPTEIELAAVERAAEDLPAARRGLALLPLGLGLRAFETLSLQRENVKLAVAGEELLAIRKGGREQLLPAEGVRPLLKDLLTAEWDVSWQILSSTSAEAAYQRLYRLIRDLGRSAGVKGMRPHKLRHGFATRMERAGASLPQIQRMMDHSSPEMTMRYVHPENKDIAKFLQTMKGKPKDEE